MRKGLRAALRATQREVERCESELARALESRAEVIREAANEGEGHVEIGKIVKLTRGRVWQVVNRR